MTETYKLCDTIMLIYVLYMKHMYTAKLLSLCVGVPRGLSHMNTQTEKAQQNRHIHVHVNQHTSIFEAMKRQVTPISCSCSF